MKAIAVMKPNQLELIDVPMPVVEPYSALVKIEASGICGSDAKIIHGTFKNIDAYPCLLGHEAVGVVQEVGEHVTAFKPGDHVFLPYHSNNLPEGMSSYWGGFAEYGLVYDYKALIAAGKGSGTPGFFESYYTMRKYPASIPAESAVMMITLREVLAACKHFGFKTGESIVIFGAGPVGLAFTKFAKILGLNPVIVCDIQEEKRAEALKMGADVFINSKELDVTTEVRKLVPEGVDYSLDAVGLNALINTGMGLIKDNGRLKTYGVSPKLDMQIDWSKAPYNWNLELFQFPIKYEEGAVTDQLITWVVNGWVDPMDFVSHVFDLEHWKDGFEIAEKRLPCKKMVITF